jgi:hypothetical protein
MKTIALHGRLRTIIPLVICATLVTAMSGCGWMVDQFQGSISTRKVPIEVVTVTTKVQSVVNCLETPGGMCKVEVHSAFNATQLRTAWALGKQSGHRAAIIAATALDDPTAEALQEIMGYASGVAVQGQKPTELSRTGTRSFAKNLFDATNTGGWTKLAIDLRTEREKIVPTRGASDPQAQMLARAIDLASTVGAYLSAYFENGNFVTITIDPSHLEATAASELELKLGFSPNAANGAVGDIEKQLVGESVGADGKYHLLTAKGDGGFVTRGGDKYSIPTISANFTPGLGRPFSASKVDFPQIGADVVRVFIEAVGDYWSRLPGVPQATGVKAQLLTPFAADAPMPPMNETQFMSVNDWATRAETATAGATGQFIRGIGWVSLNNEALAKIIETAAGVAVRKGTEKVAWCVLACGGVRQMNALMQSDDANIATIQVSIIE